MGADESEGGGEFVAGAGGGGVGEAEGVGEDGEGGEENGGEEEVGACQEGAEDVLGGHHLRAGVGWRTRGAGGGGEDVVLRAVREAVEEEVDG